jgi:aminoglycoside N3'-acetyltransferase
MGSCSTGTRRIIPIVGGTATGPLIQGRLLDVGADWQTVTTNHVAELDARYAIKTLDGAVIEVVSRGIRHASREVAERIRAGEEVPTWEYYMRTAIRLDCGHPDYAWVNRSLFVATGGKVGAVVSLSVYRVA